MAEDGHFRCYISKKFSAEHEKIIDAANHVIDEYLGKGLSLTLRQIYYQFVVRGWLENKQTEYSRLGGILSDARLAGLVSWTAMEDRTRALRGINHFVSPAEAIRNARDGYSIDKWVGQSCRVEVWVEKEALIDVLASICNNLGVDFFACKGYNSQSEQWRAGQRLARYVQKGQRPIIIHLGDHDPSGIDMTRDNQERLSLFAGTPIQVIRIALNMDQIEKYNPPPNPAKLTDSRARNYIEQYGDDSWELDALDPAVMQKLISDAVLAFRDEELWGQMLLQEVADKEAMDMICTEMGGKFAEES